MGSDDCSNLGYVNGNSKQWLNLTNILEIEFIGRKIIFSKLSLAGLGIWGRMSVKV